MGIEDVINEKLNELKPKYDSLSNIIKDLLNQKANIERELSQKNIEALKIGAQIEALEELIKNGQE